MFGWLAGKMALKVGARWAKPLAGLIMVVVVLVLLGLLYWFIASRIDNYGDRREAEGVNKERAAWVAAGEQLKADAAKSANQADDRAFKRLEEHKEVIDAESAAVAAATENGTSPLDVLFGG